ncbi:MAG: hypothetical protein HY701_00050 [Gemmatimonadetes bacterium]|nr:hypothetical protein [Gemmatimonadota bacterium]
MIAHEDDLLNNRMNWLLVIQGLLFTALDGLETKPGLVYVLIAFGFMISISSLISFVASERAIRNLLGYWNKHLADKQRSWQDFPPVFGAAIDESFFMTLDRFLSPRSFLPWAFALGWAVIFLIQVS